MLETACWILLPTTLWGISSYFFNTSEILKIPTWLYVVILFSQPILVGIVATYRIQKNHDGKLLEKWRGKDQKRFSQKKSEYYKVVEHIQNYGYFIKSIVSEKSRPFNFLITFSEKVTQKAMPVVFFNGIQLSLEIVGKLQDETICHVENIIKPHMEKLVFQLGTQEYVIDNPYYTKGQIPSEGVIWQCEGHNFEKNIFVNASYLPFVNNSTLYPFNLFANDRKIGEFSGLYYPEKGYITLDISDIKKRDCLGKSFFLKPIFGGQKIPMPSPSVLSINGKIKKEVRF